MSPKRLLRLPEARSSFDEMLEGQSVKYTVFVSTSVFFNGDIVAMVTYM